VFAARERSHLFFVCEAVVSGLCTCVGTALVRHPDGHAVVVERPLPLRDVAPMVAQDVLESFRQFVSRRPHTVGGV